jgi:three-Cys-motif partner protein
VNQTLPQVLTPGSLREKEASFCLFDQRTFECDWETVKYVSELKPAHRKVEIFYFLAQGWLDRSLVASTTDVGQARIKAWWGSDGWSVLRDLSSLQRAQLFEERFRQQLGYTYSNAWPIFSEEQGGRVMYWMIHGSDHPEAPKLMRRAYDWAVRPRSEDAEQLEMEFEAIKPSFAESFSVDS